MRRVFLLFIIFVFILLGLLFTASYRSYNVLLITIDTLRADFLSCYNPKAQSTVNIDRIARNAVLFKSAYSTIPITLPAHTAILTSREPHKLNVFNNGDVFEHKAPMITDLLEPEGYHTAAFISLGVLKSSFGLRGGFDRYEDNFEKGNGRYYKVASEMNELFLPWIEKERKSRFFAWLHYSDPHEPYITVDAPPDTEVLLNDVSVGKFCVAKKEKNSLNFIAQPGENKVEFRAIVARGPKKIQEEEAKRYIDRTIFVTPEDGIELVFGDDWLEIKLSTGAAARYFENQAVMKVINKNQKPVPLHLRFSGGVRQRIDGIRRNYVQEVQYVDKHIGILWDKLDELGLLNKTIVVLTADHGEGLKTHGNLGHVDRLYEETIRVPLIIYYPWLGNKGKSVEQIVNDLDIMPTILDLLHVKNKNVMDGRSLKQYISWFPTDWLFKQSLPRSSIFTSTYAPEARVNSFSMVQNKMKLIHSPDRAKWKWEVYDLAQDPLEKKNIAKFDAARFESQQILALRGILEDHRREAEAAHSERENPQLDEEEKQMLRELGYVGGDDENENQNQTQTQTQTNPQ